MIIGEFKNCLKIFETNPCFANTLSHGQGTEVHHLYASLTHPASCTACCHRSCQACRKEGCGPCSGRLSCETQLLRVLRGPHAEDRFMPHLCGFSGASELGSSDPCGVFDGNRVRSETCHCSESEWLWPSGVNCTKTAYLTSITDPFFL